MAAWDLSVAPACVWGALALRLGEPGPPSGLTWWHLVAASVLVPPVFWVFGLYREITRYVGPRYAWLLAQACATLSLLWLGLVLLAQSSGVGVPRTTPVIAGILMVGACAGVRLLVRRAIRMASGARHRVAIIGASDVGAGLASALAHDRVSTLVAFFDDNPSLVGGSLRGVPIHPVASFDAVLESARFDSLLVALGPKSRITCRAMLEHAAARGVRVLAVPTLNEIKDGRVNVDALKPLAIEDLLGRAPVEPDHGLLSAGITGKTVLITGAGGSIGSELCRQVLAIAPKSLVLVDNGEFNLFQIESELLRTPSSLAPGSSHPQVHRHLASVTDSVRLDQILAQHRPDTIYHAAAYKHVPMVEDNEAEGAEVNVLGSLRIAEAAVKHGVERVVFVSTDKAVRPTSVMGATKRFGEMVLQAMQEKHLASGSTRFIMVRFGNVLGSSGSVVPIFERQIIAGGPVTVTHPEVTRYFMTIPEAVQLILQAGSMGSGGEVFVLDMGAPVRIVDLARNMIRLSGRTVRDAEHPDGEIEIVFSGLRPGEKMFEELVIGAELEATAHPAILKANERFVPWVLLEPMLQRLEAAVSQHDRAGVRRLLWQAVAPASSGSASAGSVPLGRTVDT